MAASKDVLTLTLLMLLTNFMMVGTRRLGKHERVVHGNTLSYNQPATVLPSFCYEDLCTCMPSNMHRKTPSVSLNCSNNNGKLTFVPLPHVNGSTVVATLHFTFNNLTAIHTDFFTNVTKAHKINLSDNNLNYISPEAFRLLVNLIFLHLDNNPDLSSKDVASIFPLRSLSHLHLRATGLTNITGDLLKDESAPFLQVLYLRGNNLVSLNLNGLSAAKNLTFIHADDCDISDRCFVSAFMPGLQKLSLKNSFMRNLPSTCSPEGKPLFPMLTTLVMENTKLKHLRLDVCLPSLQRLDLSKTQISVFYTDMFNGVDRFPNLNELVLNRLHVQYVQDYAFRHPTLEYLSIRNSHLAFGDNVVEKRAFFGCPRLTYLKLDHCLMNDESVYQLFEPLTNLRTLFLENCNIRTITNTTFNRLRNLTKLSINRNKLTELPEDSFDDLINLTELGLGSNQLKVISENTFSRVTRQRLSKLDLSGNKFTCDCSILWFKKWLLSSPQLFQQTKYAPGYFCGNDPTKPVSKTLLPEQACLLSQETYKFLTASLALLLTASTTALLVFQFRWHLRLLLYEAFRGRDDLARLRRLRENRFDYDVFVSYAQEDLHWVQHFLMPALEGGMGLRLCIHERDFVPGNQIVDNISDCVERSKKILMVFSRHFVRSQWCQFELTYCLSHVMEFDDALIVTCIGNMATLEPTAAMMAVLKTTTYIQWQRSEAAMAAFWGRIRIALTDIMQEVAV
jgi:Leucine-rich repeat (LRR) protein